MKTTKFFFFVVLSLVIFFYSCENKKEKVRRELIEEFKAELQLTPEQNQAMLDSINEILAYEFDKAKAEEYKPAGSLFQFFNKDKAKIFFVKKWNTPDYDLEDNWTGCAWDGNIFCGHKIGDRVYYVDEHKTRKKYFQETGDSVIFAERYFPADGVTTDPRETCWWISNVMDVIANDSTPINLKEFVQEASINRSNPEFVNYINKIQNDILATNGKSIRRKIINYTACTLKGSPESWNAWEYPGYY